MQLSLCVTYLPDVRRTEALRTETARWLLRRSSSCRRSQFRETFRGPIGADGQRPDGCRHPTNNIIRTTDFMYYYYLTHRVGRVACVRAVIETASNCVPARTFRYDLMDSAAAAIRTTTEWCPFAPADLSTFNL